MLAVTAATRVPLGALLLVAYVAHKHVLWTNAPLPRAPRDPAAHSTPLCVGTRIGGVGACLRGGSCPGTLLAGTTGYFAAHSRPQTALPETVGACWGSGGREEAAAATAAVWAAGSTKRMRRQRQSRCCERRCVVAAAKRHHDMVAGQLGAVGSMHHTPADRADVTPWTIQANCFSHKVWAKFPSTLRVWYTLNATRPLRQRRQFARKRKTLEI